MKAFGTVLLACVLVVFAIAYKRHKEAQDKLAASKPVPGQTAPVPKEGATSKSEEDHDAETEPYPATAPSVPVVGSRNVERPAAPRTATPPAPKVTDERTLMVAVEGRRFDRLNFEPAGSAFFAFLNGRAVLVLSGANIHGFEDVRFILHNGAPLPKGRFASATCRDLVVMEVPSGDWAAVEWPSTSDALSRGAAVSLRGLSYTEGQPVESLGTGSVVSFEGTRYLLSGAAAPAGALALDATRGLVGVVSLDPRLALLGQTPANDPNAPAVRLVVTSLVQSGPTGIAWNTKSFDAIAATSRRVLDLPRRTVILTQLIGTYPGIAGVVEDQEFFQLVRDFSIRYAEQVDNVANLAGVQLDYGRQLEGRLAADVERVLNETPITYQRWAAEEVRRARESLRNDLLAKRRMVELVAAPQAR